MVKWLDFRRFFNLEPRWIIRMSHVEPLEHTKCIIYCPIVTHFIGILQSERRKVLLEGRQTKFRDASSSLSRILS